MKKIICILVICSMILSSCINMHKKVGKYIPAKNNFSSFKIFVNYDLIPEDLEIVFVNEEIKLRNSFINHVEDLCASWVNEFIFVDKTDNKLHVFHNVLVIDVMQILFDYHDYDLSRYLRHHIDIIQEYKGEYDLFVKSHLERSLDGTFTYKYYEDKYVKSQEKYPIIAYIEGTKPGGQIKTKDLSDANKLDKGFIAVVFTAAVLVGTLVYGIGERRTEKTEETEDDGYVDPGK